MYKTTIIQYVENNFLNNFKNDFSNQLTDELAFWILKNLILKNCKKNEVFEKNIKK